MSVVKLHDGESLPVEALRETAAGLHLTVPEQDEKDYLLLLTALDGTAQELLALPDYEPNVTDLSALPRENIHRPAPGDNPCNGWSHRFSLKAKTPVAGGVLAGRTVCVKDNVGVAGVPSTLGTTVVSGYTPTMDATVVTRVVAAGGEIVGTAVCENFSMAPLSYTSASGVVHNPHGEGYTAGGSSSGCGALVGIGAVDMGIGGDQGGSIRLPAAYCGIVGFKPTHGLIPYTGIASLEPIIDHTGPMTRSVLDNARLLKALAGTDGLDDRQTFDSPPPAAVPDYAGVLGALARAAPSAAQLGAGLKVGILLEGFAAPGLDPAVGAAVRAAAEKFAQTGAVVEEVSIPLHALGPAIWTCSTRAGIAINGVQGYANGRKGYHLARLAQQLGAIFSTSAAESQKAYATLSAANPAAVNALIGGMYLHRTYPGLTGKAINHVRQLRDAYEAAFAAGGYDVLITPTVPTVAMRHPPPDAGPLEKIKYAVGSTMNTCPFNSSGHPALSLPVGKLPVADEEGKAKGIKMPVGMQIVGKLWGEEQVYKAAFAWEQNFDWTTM